MRRNRFLLGAFLSVLLCASLVIPVNAEAAMWVQNYDGGVDWEMAWSLVETSDGGYALTGCGPADTSLLVKTDASGNVEWNSTYGGRFRSLVETSDGGYALAGATNSFGAGGYDFWLVKTDAAGNMEWNVTYGGAGDDAAFSLIATSDGGYALAGAFNGSPKTWENYYFAGYYPTGGDFWLVKTDSFGDVEWNQTYGGAEDDWATSLVETSDGGYALAGTTNSFDFWLVKTNATGNMEWNSTYGGTGDEFAHSLVETSDGGYALAGITAFVVFEYSMYELQRSDSWLVKVDAFGDVEWNQTYGEELLSDYAYSLVETSDGGYAIAGTWDFSDDMYLGLGWEAGIHGAFWLVKVDAFGDVEWNQTYGYGRGCIEEAYSLVAASDGGYALAGYTINYTAGNHDFWLIKTDENGVAPVAPEAAWVILPFLLAATSAIFISKKKLLLKHS